MKKIFALTLSLIMFSAFASTQFDSGGFDKDVQKQKTEISQQVNQSIPVVADIYIADDIQATVIPDILLASVKDEQLSIINNISIFLSKNILHKQPLAKVKTDYRRTDHDYSLR